MIFLHLLEMLGDSTSVDIQSASDFSGSDIPIAGDKLQNGISRFWSTFLVHLFDFWSTFLVHLLLLLLYLSIFFRLHFDICDRNIFLHRFPVFKNLVSQVLRVLFQHEFLEGRHCFFFSRFIEGFDILRFSSGCPYSSLPGRRGS